MRTANAIAAVITLLGSGGCFLTNNWHTESFSDQHTFPATDAAIAVRDENRIIGLLPSLGFKRDDHSSGMPTTEAVFIRSDTDHFHITVTVRTLARLDQPGFITTVHVDSYNIGEEGAVNAGQSVLNEIDQLYRKGA